MLRNIRVFSLIGLFSVLGSGEALAAGFAVRENSAESVATVFAGNASRGDDVATVFNNPAAMAALQGAELEVGGALVVPDMHFSGSSTIGGTSLPGDNHREIGLPALIPHIYGVFDLTDRMKAGLAITVPFGNTIDYGNAWSGRYVNIKTSALALDINPNLSYRLTDWLSVGGGVSLQYLRLGLESGIAQSVIFGAGAPDSSFDLRVANWNWGYNLGLFAEPWEGTRLGFAYRSGIAHDTRGVFDLAQNTNSLLGLSTAAASTDLHLPASFTASVTQKIAANFTLSSDVQLSEWHVFQNVSVLAPPNPNFVFAENYRDSWMISVGGKYRLNDAWSLMAGLGYDESPVTDAFRDTGVPDKDRYMIGFGPDIRLNESTSLAIGYAYYFGSSATMDKSVNAVDPISGVVLHGHYDNALNYLAVSLRKAL